IVSVDGANSRSKVPAVVRAISWLICGIGFGEHPVCAGRQVAIMGARTVHIHVAQGHVVENACTGHAIAKGGVAGGVAPRAILGAGNGVVSGIRITGTGASGLIYERLYGSHYRRRDRSSAKTGPRVGRPGTGSSSVNDVGVAGHVVVPPQPVRSE